jgi:hypothetical protein
MADYFSYRPVGPDFGTDARPVPLSVAAGRVNVEIVDLMAHPGAQR